MFRIKICGITNPEDAILAAEVGADAIGLNFFPKSPRYVSLDRAQEIVAALRSRASRRVTLVGVFVDTPVDKVVHIAATLNLDFVQFHGHEDPAAVWETYRAFVGAVGLIRAFRLGKLEDLEEIGNYLQSLRRSSHEFEQGRMPLRALLIDAASPRGLGGTGELADWSLAAQLGQMNLGLPRPALILAGGLNPSNVEKAIHSVHPDAVDVASGVESIPGKKDPQKVRDFVEAALRAFRSLSETSEIPQS